MQGRYGCVECQYTGCQGVCESDYVCRCDQITDARVTSLDVPAIVREFIPQKDLNTLKGYCKERALRHCGVFDPANWKPIVEQGYYGEECDGISLNETVLSKAKEALKTGLTIPKVLTLEYGHLLPILEKRKWNIVTVRRNSVLVGQYDYYTTKLNAEIVDSYKEYEFPVCVCIPTPDQGHDLVRLIDGHHRFAATDGKRKIKIVLGSK